MPAYPEASYLESVGRLVYAVATLEWLMLGDLARHADALPADISVRRLAGSTTGRIAERLAAASTAVADDAVREWLESGARSLAAAAEIRNHLLHARPATLSGRQRLYRWRLTRTERDAFGIDDEWIDARRAEVEGMCREVDRLRMAARRDR